MTSPRHPTRPGLDRTPTPVVEAVERETTESYGQQPTNLDNVVELALRRRCEICQKDGGAMHALAEEVKGVAAKVEAAVATLNERRGEKRVWGILRAVSVPVLIAAATLVINHLSAKRSEEQTIRQARQAAEVAQELRSFRALQAAEWPAADMAKAVTK